MRTIHSTDYRTYTPAEVIDEFSVGFSSHNIRLLIRCLTTPEIALMIEGVMEENNIYYNYINGQMMRVTPRKRE